MVFLWKSFTKRSRFGSSFIIDFLINNQPILSGIKPVFNEKKIYSQKDNASPNFPYKLMNISPHLLIDTVILSAALTITLVLRAKGNAARKEKKSK